MPDATLADKIAKFYFPTNLRWEVGNKMKIIQRHYPNWRHSVRVSRDIRSNRDQRVCVFVNFCLFSVNIGIDLYFVLNTSNKKIRYGHFVSQMI